MDVDDTAGEIVRAWVSHWRDRTDDPARDRINDVGFFALYEMAEIASRVVQGDKDALEPARAKVVRYSKEELVAQRAELLSRAGVCDRRELEEAAAGRGLSTAEEILDELERIDFLLGDGGAS